MTEEAAAATEPGTKITEYSATAAALHTEPVREAA